METIVWYISIVCCFYLVLFGACDCIAYNSNIHACILYMYMYSIYNVIVEMHVFLLLLLFVLFPIVLIDISMFDFIRYPNSSQFISSVLTSLSVCSCACFICFRIQCDIFSMNTEPGGKQMKHTNTYYTIDVE